jgi:hypothetical protein
MAASITKNFGFFPFCSPTEIGAANIAAPMGEELQPEGDKTEKRCKPLAGLYLFALQLQPFLTVLTRNGYMLNRK